MRALALAAATLMLLGLSVQGQEKKDNAEKLLGNWTATKCDEGTIPVGTVVSFAKDGKMKVTFKKDGQEQTATDGLFKPVMQLP